MQKKQLRHTSVGIVTAAAITAGICFLTGCRAPGADMVMETESGSEKKELTEVQNGGIPDFDEHMFSVTENSVSYNSLDSLGRSTGMTAVLSADQLRDRKEVISPNVTTTGYHTVWYDNIKTRTGKKGAYLWQRCHLLKSRLGGSADDNRNFFTGTYALNYAPGMGEYESQIIHYLKSSKNHVLYRVTPVYEGDNLIASGVILEAASMEDHGAGLCFNIFIRNIQPGIHIDYSNGFSSQER